MNTKGKEIFTVGKPDRHHLPQTIKANITRNRIYHILPGMTHSGHITSSIYFWESIKQTQTERHSISYLTIHYFSSVKIIGNKEETKKTCKGTRHDN